MARCPSIGADREHWFGLTRIAQLTGRSAF